jgi:hypothetical protein
MPKCYEKFQEPYISPDDYCIKDGVLYIDKYYEKLNGRYVLETGDVTICDSWQIAEVR